MPSYDLFGDPTAGYAVTKNSNMNNVVNYNAPTPQVPTFVPDTPSPSYISMPSYYGTNSNPTQSIPNPSYTPPAPSYSTPTPTPATPPYAAAVSTPSYSYGGGGGSSYVPPGPTAAELEEQRKKKEADNNYSNMLAMLENLKKIAPVQVTPPSYNPFISNSEMMGKMGLLQSAMDKYNAPYSLDSDQQYQTAVQSMEKNLTKQFAKRGMAYSNSAKGAIAQKTAELGNQFQQQEMLRRQQNIQNLAQQLGVLTNFEKTNYDQWRNTVNDTNQANTVNYNNFSDLLGKALGMQNQTFNQDVTKAGLTGQFQGQPTAEQQQQQNKNEMTTYGTMLTPQIRQQLQLLDKLPPGIKMTDVTKYYNDYAAEINRRAKEFPDDPMIPYLMAARTQKILSTPELMQQYGKEIGLANPQIAQNALKYQQAQSNLTLDNLKIYAEKIKAEYLPVTEKAKLDEAIANAEKGKWEAAKAKIEAINAPEEVKLDLKYKLEQIKSQQANQIQSLASAGASGANAALAGQRLNTEAYNTEEARIKAALASQDLNSDTPRLYQSYLQSGKNFDDWFKSDVLGQGKANIGNAPYSGATAGPANVTWAETMSQPQFKQLLDALQKTGKFDKPKTSIDGMDYINNPDLLKNLPK